MLLADEVKVSGKTIEYRTTFGNDTRVVIVFLQGSPRIIGYFDRGVERIPTAFYVDEIEAFVHDAEQRIKGDERDGC